MFWTFVVPVISTIFLVEFLREKLTFRSGLLSRKLSKTSEKISTSMGESKFVELSLGKVNYVFHRSSSEKSTVNIFVHGYSTGMMMWRTVFNELVRDDENCLAFDLYGRGFSDAPDFPMNVDFFVSQLVEMIFSLNLTEKKLHLFGVSMGGAIVQRFAQLYPSNVSKLVLCCAAGNGTVSVPRIFHFALGIPIVGPILFQIFNKNNSDKRERANWAFPDRPEFQEYRKYFKTTIDEHPGFLRSLFSTITNFQFVRMEQTIEHVRNSNIPVLILWGDRDRLIPVESAYQFQQDYPRSTIQIVPQATHMLLMEIEHVQQTLPTVRSFLKS